MAIIFGSPEANQIAEADRQRQRQINVGYSPSWRSTDGWQLVDLFMFGNDSSSQRGPNDSDDQHNSRCTTCP